MNLLEYSAKQIQQIQPAKWLIGFSGGKDSAVLLSIFVKLKQQGVILAPIHVIHVNHKISKNADAWQMHCQNTCNQYQLPLTIEKLSSSIKQGESLEAFARNQRYQKIKKHLKKNEVFVSAHHQRDQAETFLLQLMRGAGLDGLKSMPKIRPLGEGSYFRPFLDLPFSEIERYAKSNQIDFIYDESNEDLSFDRNFIRHQVIPILEKQFPAAQKKIATSAKWLSELSQASAPSQLMIEALKNKTEAQQKEQIKSYFKEKTGLVMSMNALNYVCKHHIYAKVDKSPEIEIGKFVVRRFKQQIVITQHMPANFWYEQLPSNVNVNQSYQTEGAEIIWEQGEGIDISHVRSLIIKPVNSQLIVNLHSRDRRCTLKKILNEQGIPYWIRSQFFGLFNGNQLVAIPSVGVTKSFYEKSEKAYFPVWKIAQKFVKI